MRTHTHIQSSGDSVKSMTDELDSFRSKHRPVLLHEVLAELRLVPGECVVDATLGGGGHARALAEAIGTTGTFIGLDADTRALARAQERLHDVVPHTAEFIHENFRNVGVVLDTLGIVAPDAFLFDLGWSSDQLEVSGRGFSFLRDEPLLMTLSDEADGRITAREIVNEWDEEHIADILFGWGEERYARRIAKAIVAARTEGDIATTFELVAIIQSAVPKHYAHARLHPATRTFQALRIATNDELGALKEALAGVRTHAKQGSRVAIISFHSLEDRIVKNTFREWQRDELGAPTTKKPITPAAAELAANPRARSAKLRVFTFS